MNLSILIKMTCFSLVNTDGYSFPTHCHALSVFIASSLSLIEGKFLAKVFCRYALSDGIGCTGRLVVIGGYLRDRILVDEKGYCSHSSQTFTVWLRKKVIQVVIFASQSELSCKNYLRKHFWKEHTFWTDGYFVCSVGNVSEEMLRKYIENQE